MLYLSFSAQVAIRGLTILDKAAWVQYKGCNKAIVHSDKIYANICLISQSAYATRTIRWWGMILIKC